jgi:hypothetical protein
MGTIGDERRANQARIEQNRIRIHKQTLATSVRLGQEWADREAQFNQPRPWIPQETLPPYQNPPLSQSATNGGSSSAIKGSGNHLLSICAMVIIFLVFAGIAQTEFNIVATPGIAAFAAGGLLLTWLAWRIRMFLFWSSGIAVGLYLVYYFIHNS